MLAYPLSVGVVVSLLAGCGRDGPPPPPWAMDADGDGALVDQDCDDHDDQRYPGAVERCDGIDNDCDGNVDVDAVDAVDWYPDIDLDGFGDPLGARQLCTGPQGFVDVGGDCMDTRPDIHPDGNEVCDGIDNDCDGIVDPFRVPTDYPTVQAALGVLPDGGEICLEPGTHSDPFAIYDDRPVTVTGVGGSDVTVFDLSTMPVGPFVTSRSHGFVLQGVTVTGFEGEASEGPFLDMAGGAVLRDVVFADNTVWVTPSSDYGSAGGMIHAFAGTLELTDVEVHRLTVRLLGSGFPSVAPFGWYGTPSLELQGAFLYALLVELDVNDLIVSDMALVSESVVDPCSVEGLLLFQSHGTLVLDGLDVQGGQLDYACGGSARAAGIVLACDWCDVIAHDVEVRDVEVNVSSDGTAHNGGLIGAGHWSSVDIDHIELSNNRLTATGTHANIEGVLTLSGRGLVADVAHYTAHGNSSHAEGQASSQACGVALCMTNWDAKSPSTFKWTDLRSNHTRANYVSGGAAELSGWVTMTNAILAGNTAGASGTSRATGGGMHIRSDEHIDDIGVVTLQHVDVVNNVAIGSAADGGGLFVDDGLNLLVTESNLSANGVVAPSGATGSAVAATDAASVTSWRYNNVFANTGAAAFSYTDPAGTAGNVAEDPEHTDVDGPDPMLWELTLAPTSPLIDMGDPTLLDADGTRSDIGAHGGLLGAGW